MEILSLLEMTMNGEWERILKEAMVSYLKALPTYSHVTLMTLQRISD
jgi:hypothetical protein